MKDGMKVLVKQVRSSCSRDDSIRATLSALGLGKIGKSCEHTMNKSILGMLKKVKHIIKVQES